MFANFDKAFSNMKNRIYCKSCSNVNKCIDNGIIFLYKDGTYQPLHSYSYFDNYGCYDNKQDILSKGSFIGTDPYSQDIKLGGK